MVGFSLVLTAFLLAQDDPDFATQGEYVGEAINPESAKKGKFGMHIIALGGDTFRAVAYWGGLPGDGWDRTGKRDQWEGKRADGALKIQAGAITIAVGKGAIALTKADGTEIGNLKKAERVSPTMGAKPPEGAVILFDGTKDSLKNWKDGAKISDDGLLMQGATSKPTFGDHTLHIEFRIPFEPKNRGQGRGNSGCYLQGRYEVQMLDSFGLEGENNECGGLYSIRKPDVNMCFPPMSWQTYDVDYTAAKFDAAGKKSSPAKMTVRHNGVVVHKDVELPKSTNSALVGEGADAGPVYLQDHGNPVRYRNVWVLPKK